MMTKQRFALLAALLLCVPLLFGATAASDAPSEAPVSRGESFSMGEYVLDRDDDYFHFSKIFKKYTGYSPKKFRENVCKKKNK